MTLYSTCRVCTTLLLVTDEFEPPVHPFCVDDDTPPTSEQLATRFLTAVLDGDTDAADRLEKHIDAIHHAPPRLGEAALIYASWGWPVFPAHPGDKTPITRHGFKDATTNTAQIRRWWTDTPHANIAVPTGDAFDVIDVDVPHGWPAWQRITTADLLPDIHAMVSTARGGLHAYTQPTGDGNAAGVLPGIDYRGRGGYVIAPPSQRPTGRWRWRTKPSPALTSSRQAMPR